MYSRSLARGARSLVHLSEVSIRQHTSAYVRIRQHTSALARGARSLVHLSAASLLRCLGSLLSRARGTVLSMSSVSFYFSHALFAAALLRDT